MNLNPVMQMPRSSFCARLWVLLLLITSGMAPLHLRDEVHAVFPASARHHAFLHAAAAFNEAASNSTRAVFRPLDGQEHRRHEEVQCALDGAFALAPASHLVKADALTFLGQILDFAPLTLAIPLRAGGGVFKCPPPPEQAESHLNPSLSLRSGRGPPTPSKPEFKQL